MDKWIGVIVLVFVSVIGLVRLILGAKAFNEKRNFSIDFFNNYREFANGLMNQTFDGEKYQWLKLNSSKMQIIMGDYGIASTYKPAGANYMIRNYQMIVNGISEIKETYLRMDHGFGLSFEIRMLRELIGAIDDVLLTYVGSLDSNRESRMRDIKNPFVWFREGVRFIVTFPIYLMHWSGLIQYTTYYSFSNNIIVKFITFIIGIIAFISSIVTIVTGYTPFIKIIDDFIQSKGSVFGK